MNILFIHPVMFHPQRGGIERVSDLLCREFIRRGHHVLCLHSVRDESRMDYVRGEKRCVSKFGRSENI